MRSLEAIVAQEKETLIRLGKFVVIEKVGSGWGLVGYTDCIAGAAIYRDDALERTHNEVEIQIWKRTDKGPVEIFTYIPGKKEA